LGVVLWRIFCAGRGKTEAAREEEGGVAEIWMQIVELWEFQDQVFR
jgi:hypothetical protein